jgi:hypothetical protein
MSENIHIWLIIIAVLVIFAGIAVGMMNKFSTSPNRVFQAKIVGNLARVNGESIVHFISGVNPDEVRVLLFVDPQVFKDKKGNMKRAIELYSLIDKVPKIYSDIFQPVNGDIAKSEDLGGILLSHYNNKRLEIYSMSAIEEGEPINVANQQFSSKRQASDAVRQFHNNIRGIYGDYLVVIINGPELTMEQDNDGNTLLVDDDESFGMYESALESWLSHHPSGSSVDRYTRRPVNQYNYVNTASIIPPPSTDTPFTNARLQSPSHTLPTVNPDFARLIRK